MGNKYPFKIEFSGTCEHVEDFTAGWEHIETYENAQLSNFRWVLKSEKLVSDFRDKISQYLIWGACKIGGYSARVEIDISGYKKES